MTEQLPPRDSLIELHDALAQHQLRDAGAEVAAAIAHAVGTPLNVISGRAELIRHDPSNALAQVARIEEQVKKLATGLRQLVDYLALPDPQAPQRAAMKRTPADAAAAARASANAERPAPAPPPVDGAAVVVLVDAKSVVDDIARLSEPLASAAGVELVVDTKALNGARVERWHALGTLNALVSGALHHVSLQQGAQKAAGAGRSGPARVRVAGRVAEQGVIFELVVPGLALVEGWQLEHFQARPAPADVPEFYRTLSVCGAVARGHGGRLLLEAAPEGEALVVRFSCRNEGG